MITYAQKLRKKLGEGGLELSGYLSQKLQAYYFTEGRDYWQEKAVQGQVRRLVEFTKKEGDLLGQFITDIQNGRVRFAQNEENIKDLPLEGRFWNIFGAWIGGRFIDSVLSTEPEPIQLQEQDGPRSTGTRRGMRIGYSVEHAWNMLSFFASGFGSGLHERMHNLGGNESAAVCAQRRYGLYVILQDVKVNFEAMADGRRAGEGVRAQFGADALLNEYADALVGEVLERFLAPDRIPLERRTRSRFLGLSANKRLVHMGGYVIEDLQAVVEMRAGEGVRKNALQTIGDELLEANGLDMVRAKREGTEQCRVRKAMQDALWKLATQAREDQGENRDDFGVRLREALMESLETQFDRRAARESVFVPGLVHAMPRETQDSNLKVIPTRIERS